MSDEKKFDLDAVQDPDFCGGLSPVEYLNRFHDGTLRDPRPAVAADPPGADIIAAVIRMWEADTGIRFPGAHPPTEAGYPMLYRYARAALPEVKARELDRIIDEVEGTAAPAPGSGEASER